MNEKGSQNFIKLDRRLLNHEIMKDSLAFHLFVYCILRAEWQTVDDKGVTVPRGSFMTTMREVAYDLGCSYQSVRTRLNKLTRCDAEYLTRLKIGKRLMITVVHYNKWQGANTISNTMSGTKNGSLPIKEKEYKKGGQESQWET